MRKVLVAAICGALIAPMAFGQTNVLSANAVGYVKKTIDKGNLALVSQDFYAIDGSTQTVSTVVADQVPVGSRVFVWNGTSFEIENYQAGAKGAADFWSPDTNPLEPGVGFFVEIPDGAAEASYDVYLMGEVPSASTAPSTTMTKAEGLSLLGYPYPVEVSWTDTDVAMTATVGDRMFLWDSAAGSYQIANYQAGAKGAADFWSNEGDTIGPGVGFFYDNTSGGDVAVTEVKGYDWP